MTLAQGITLSDRYKHMLHKVLEALPAEDRLLFLAETINTLTVSERKELSQKVNEQKKANKNRPTEEPSNLQDPSDIQQIQAPKPIPAVPEASVAALPLEAQQAIAGARAKAEHESADTTTPPAQHAVVEAEFKKFLAKTDRKSKKSMRLELLSCLGLGLVGIALIVLLAVAGRTAFDWIMDVSRTP